MPLNRITDNSLLNPLRESETIGLQNSKTNHPKVMAVVKKIAQSLLESFSQQNKNHSNQSAHNARQLLPVLQTNPPSATKPAPQKPELRTITAELLGPKKPLEKLNAARNLIVAYQNFKSPKDYQEAGKLFTDLNNKASLENKLSAVVAMKMAAVGYDECFNLTHSSAISKPQDKKIWSNYFKTIINHPEFITLSQSKQQNDAIESLIELVRTPFESMYHESSKQELKELYDKLNIANQSNAEPQTLRFSEEQFITPSASFSSQVSFSSPLKSFQILERNNSPKGVAKYVKANKEEGKATIFHSITTLGRKIIYEYRLAGKKNDENELENIESVIDPRADIHLIAEFGNDTRIKPTADFRGQKYTGIGYNDGTLLMSAALSKKITNLKQCWKLIKKNNQTRIIKEIISKHDYFGDNLLSTVAKSGDPKMIQYCTKKIGIKINQLDKNLRSIIHNAASAGNVDNLNYVWNSFFNRLRFNAVRHSKDINNDNALILAAKSDSPEAVEFCIKKLKIPIKEGGQFGRNPILAAASCGKIDNIKKIIACIEEQPNAEKSINEAISTTDHSGKGLLELIAQYGTEKDLTYCLSLFNKRQLLMLLPSAFEAAIISNKIKNIESLWSFAKHTFNGKQFQALIDNKIINGRNILNLAAKEGGIHSIDFCFSHIQLNQIFSPKEMVDAFCAAASGGKVENIDYLYGLIINHNTYNLTPEQKIDLLGLVKNALCLSSRYGTPESIEFIVDKISANFSDGELHDVMSKAILEAAGSDHSDRIEKLWSICQNKFSKHLTYSLSSILNAKDQAGNSILLVAAKYGTPKTIEFCIQKLKTDYYQKNNEGYDALMNAAAEGRTDNMQKISELTFYIPGQGFINKTARAITHAFEKEINDYIFTKNALTVSAQFSNAETIRYCVDFLDMRIDIKDDQKMNALACAIVGGKFENIKTVWEIAQEKLKYHEIIELLTSNDLNNGNVLKHAANSNDQTVKSMFNEIAKFYRLPQLNIKR